MTKYFLIVLAIVSGASWAAPAAAQDQSEDAEALRPKVEKYVALQKEVEQFFTAKNYDGVIAKCDEMIAIFPDRNVPYYNKACAFAREGKADAAFEQLALSVEKGFNEPAHMRRDEDLESLRKDKRYEELLEKAADNERKVDGDPEPGEAMPGVRTLEDTPDGGLRYRLRMSPNATKEKPNRLIVWLHGSGGSSNATVEALAPRFIEKGFALVVLTQKSWVGWSTRDAARLVTGTLPALAKIDGLDARKPVLMGFSAGGQVALLLWQHDPSQWGGIILDASYPVDVVGPGQVDMMKPPKGDAAKTVPIFAFIGEDDGGARAWQNVAPGWHKAGIPLRVDVVPGKGHAWLLGKFQLAALDAWLSDVAAGKIPAVPVDKPTDAKPEPPAVEPGDPNAKPEPPEVR